MKFLLIVAPFNLELMERKGKRKRRGKREKEKKERGKKAREKKKRHTTNGWLNVWCSANRKTIIISVGREYFRLTLNRNERKCLNDFFSSIVQNQPSITIITPRVVLRLPVRAKSGLCAVVLVGARPSTMMICRQSTGRKQSHSGRC